jgi:hypothetical protein
MINGWYKRFIGGKIEKGRDGDSEASWSRGRLHGMDGAAIHHNGKHITISGAGKYWQSDDYEFSVSTGETHLVTRRLQRKISSYDQRIYQLETENSTMLSVSASVYQMGPVIPIIDKRGQWLTIELDVETEKVNWYYSKDRL